MNGCIWVTILTDSLVGFTFCLMFSIHCANPDIGFFFFVTGYLLYRGYD